MDRLGPATSSPEAWFRPGPDLGELQNTMKNQTEMKSNPHPMRYARPGAAVPPIPGACRDFSRSLMPRGYPAPCRAGDRSLWGFAFSDPTGNSTGIFTAQIPALTWGPPSLGGVCPLNTPRRRGCACTGVEGRPAVKSLSRHCGYRVPLALRTPGDRMGSGCA